MALSTLHSISAGAPSSDRTGNGFSPDGLAGDGASGDGAAGGRIRVFIADDHPSIREALATIVRRSMDIELCGEAATMADAQREIGRLLPDVAVIDLSFPDGQGLDLVREIGVRYPQVRMVVFSAHEETIYAEPALRAGASGYVMKTEPVSSLISAVRNAARGDLYVSGRVASRMMNAVAGGHRSRQAQFSVEALTERELMVFCLMGAGRAVRDIADEMGVKVATVETFRRRAKEKLGCDSVAQLLQYAIQWTLAHPNAIQAVQQARAV